MARTTMTSRASAKRAPAPAPKKRIGRPLGSKNKLTRVTKARPSPSKPLKPPATRKAAPSTPKLNKAELEAHLVKLERTIARLRKQYAELRQAAAPPPPKATPAPARATAADRTPKRPAPKTRRSAKPAAAPHTSSGDIDGESYSDD